MWPLLLCRLISCLIINSLHFYSVVSVLLVLACLLCYVGWSNFRSGLNLLECEKSESKTSKSSGSSSFWRFITSLQSLYQVKAKTRISLGIAAFVSFTFVLSASMFYLGYMKRVSEQYAHVVSPEQYNVFPTRKNVAFIRRHNQYDYTVRLDGEEYEVWFCHDYMPPSFDPGDILDYLTYQDKGTCWSLADPMKTGWKYKTDHETGKGIKVSEVSQ